nr:Cys-tRNA(Pro) deacylase [Paludisphaera mucosa]
MDERRPSRRATDFREASVGRDAGFPVSSQTVNSIQFSTRRRADEVAIAKTNAVRLLDRLGVAYELREYEVDPDDLVAESVARKIGLPPEQVFKTLVARGDKHGVCLAVVPADCELDLKAMAKATGDKKVDTVALKEVEPLTGYIRGGVTAMACKKAYPVYLEETAELFEVISVSAGVRGVQVLLAPDDYVRAVDARVAGIAKAR